MAGTFTAILNDNGVDACLYSRCREAVELLDCKFWDGRSPGIHWHWKYEQAIPGMHTSFMRYTLDGFAERFSLPHFSLTRTSVPVAYQDDSAIPSVDVVLCTAGGPWSPYRQWPYFAELKSRLECEGLSYVDLSDRRIRGNACLNYAKKCRVYVGLDTGVSHLVSSVVRHGVIVQSGYNLPLHWSTYGYAHVSIGASCQPCFLRMGCQHDHKCMVELQVKAVFGAVAEAMEHSSGDS